MRNALRPLLISAAACTLLGPIACAQAPRADSPAASMASMPAISMADIVQRYGEDERDISRFYETYWSETRFDRLDKLYADQSAALAAIDFDSLSQDAKVDYILLRNRLRHTKSFNALDRRWLAEMDPLMPFRKVIYGLEEQRWRMERVDAPAAAKDIAAIGPAIKKLRERIEKARKNENGEGADAPLAVSPVLAQRTASAIGSLRSTLRWWYDYHGQFDPGFSWWVQKPFTDADKALDEYAGYLKRDVAGLKGEDNDPLIGDPIGKETLAENLTTESIAYTPAELIAIGEREFAWCEAEIKKASREMGLGDDWKAALEKVKNSYVDPGEQTHYCTEVVREQIEFLRKNDLISLPDLTTELWRLEMITPDRQKFWPFQYYGGLHVGVGYASDEQSMDDRLQVMRGNNKHFTRIVVPHELIPGHHLQGYMSQRYHGYRGMFSTPFFVEGWALYWELKLWDLNWARGPEDRIGMLFWRMHRAARIIVSLKFHQGEMSPAQMIDFLVDRVGHERNNATSEVRRYIGGDYSPLYQCGYMIGGLEIRALHDEAIKNGMKERDFNDRILKEGSIPVELVRAAVMGTPLTRDTQASWRFAGELK